MNETDLQDLVKRAKRDTENDADTLAATLPLLDTLAGRSKAGRTRRQGKAITAAGHAADAIRETLRLTYGRNA